MSKSNDPCRTPVHRSTLRASAISAGDDSPTLSQEPMKVTWEWNRENTPVRSTAGSSKLKSDRWSKRSPINSNLYRASITSSASKKKNASAAASTALANSPKGLFKFQEEMRKIQFDSNETDTCDNDNSGRQPVCDVVSPMNVDDSAMLDENISIGVAGPSNCPPAVADCTTSDPFKQDLLNDSDFDQMLLTCTESVERKLSQEQMATQTNRQASAETDHSTVKPSQSTYMSLLNDESIDDILGNLDDSFIMQSVNGKNSKMLRHKSMPQDLQPQKLQSQPQKPSSIQQQQPPKSRATTSRKSFTRHESMPIAVTDTSSRQPNAQNSECRSEYC